MHRPLTAKELAQATGLTPGAVTTVLDRLEEAKLARRTYDENDRRRVSLELTATGRKKIDEIWATPRKWNAMAIRNTAHVSWFSSDRTIRQYAADIWNVPVEKA
jgi:DNA-binding MarR family transcriptional regulator